MCGDIESEESRVEELYARFVEHAHYFAADLAADNDGRESGQLYTYLDSLFRSMLTTVAAHDKAPEEISGYERLRMEPLVYARLAGFIAAHQPLEDDPLRRLIEAMLTGYSEGEAMVAEHHGHATHDHAH
jgi:hypothetical protein